MTTGSQPDLAVPRTADERSPSARRFAHAAAPAVPALVLLALTLYLAFHAGGYFSGPTGLATVVVAVALVVRTTVARRPFEGLGGGAALLVGAMALYTVWTLVSSAWSDAPGRALIEFDRALLYTLTALLFASFGGTPRRFRWLLRGAALSLFVVCLAGVATRVAPDHFTPKLPIAPQRLSFPLTYWNAVGIVAGLALVLLAGLTAGRAEARTTRVLAAAAMPVVTAALILSYSRGGIAAALVGLVAWLIVARPPLVLAAAPAIAPGVILTIVRTADADLISSANPTSPAAVAQGHDLATVL